MPGVPGRRKPPTKGTTRKPGDHPAQPGDRLQPTRTNYKCHGGTTKSDERLPKAGHNNTPAQDRDNCQPRESGHSRQKKKGGGTAAESTTGGDRGPPTPQQWTTSLHRSRRGALPAADPTVTGKTTTHHNHQVPQQERTRSHTRTTPHPPRRAASLDQEGWGNTYEAHHYTRRITSPTSA